MGLSDDDRETIWDDQLQTALRELVDGSSAFGHSEVSKDSSSFRGAVKPR